MCIRDSHGVIAPSPEQVQRDTAAADTDNDTIWIGCEKSSRKNTVAVSYTHLQYPEMFSQIAESWLAARGL